MLWFIELMQSVLRKEEFMWINDETIALVKQCEGLSLKPYLCPAGVATIGYGRTHGITMKTPEITREQAEAWLIEDLEAVGEDVLKVITQPMNENQFGALTSFAYNVGIGNLRRSKLLRLFNDGDVMGAADEFLRWTRAGKKVLLGLERRRKAERKLFLKPVLIEKA